MRSRPCSPRCRPAWLFATLLAALALLGAARAPAATCGVRGAVYDARPTVPAYPDASEPPPTVRYRLRIGDPPADIDGSAIAELYSFETVSRRTGRVESTLRMLRICGVGRAPCVVAPPDRNKAGDGYASTETDLNRDLSIDTRPGAPDALLLPGFGETDWSPDFTADWLAADLRYLTPAHVVPDLGDQLVWIRVRCGV